MFHSHPLPKLGSFAPLGGVWLTIPHSQQKNENKPAHIIHTPAAMFRGLMVTQFQRPAKAQAGKKEVFSDHHDPECPWPAPVGTGWWVERPGGPKGAWNAGKSPPLVSFCSEGCSNNYLPCVEQHLLPHGVQDVHLDFMCQGRQTVPAGSTSEQHRASSAETWLAHRKIINPAEVNPALPLTAGSVQLHQRWAEKSQVGVSGNTKGSE